MGRHAIYIERLIIYVELRGKISFSTFHMQKYLSNISGPKAKLRISC